MGDWQQRVVEEKTELDLKRGRLEEFILSDGFVAIVDAEKGRMKKQAEVMEEYSKILGERIAAFA